MEIDPGFWDIMKLDEIKHRLAFRGINKSKNPDGSRMEKADYLNLLKSLQ